MTAHPLHPAFVHWPLALITTSYGIDVLRPLLLRLPEDHVLLTLFPSSADLRSMSYYALSAGLLAALPALISGVMQANAVLQKLGGVGGSSIYEDDNVTLKPKIRTLFLHAALNDVALLATFGHWWLRRRWGGSECELETWMVVLNVALGGLLLFAASLGGRLVYRHGTGVGFSPGPGAASKAKKR